MSSLQELQFPIDQAIFAELLPCLPAHWGKAKLLASQKSGGTRLSVRIDGLGQSGVAAPSDELQSKIRELFVLNNQFNSGLIGIEYSYSREPDGKWSFAGDYQYAD
jgi:hypothetical protein